MDDDSGAFPTEQPIDVILCFLKDFLISLEVKPPISLSTVVNNVIL